MANKNPPNQFKRGKSGNPGGRPKVLKGVRDLARVHTARAIEVLFEIMDDESANKQARIAAAKELLDRGYGRPPQDIQVGGLEEIVIDLTRRSA